MPPHHHHEQSATGAADAFRFAVLLPLFALLIALWAGTAHPLHHSLQKAVDDAQGPVATLSSMREQLLPPRRTAEGSPPSTPDPLTLPATAFTLALPVLALARPRAVAAPTPALPLVLRPAAPRAPPRIPVRA